MGLKELQAKLRALFAEGEALKSKTDGWSEEDYARIDTLQSEIDEATANVKRVENLERISALGKQSTPMLNLGGADVEPPKGDKRSDDDQGWKSAGEFFMAVKEAATPGYVLDKRLTTGIKAASGLNESVPSDGGFLVQSEFAAELIKRTYETGVLASRARRGKIGPNANGLKVNAIDETSRANGSRWGGVAAYWEGEADAYTATRPKFRQMEMKLKKLTGLCYATDELLDDATALEDVLMQAFAEEFGFKVDDAMINGTGAGMPLGIMNAPALVSVAKETSQDAATIMFENIVKMWARMWGRSRQNAAWFINQDIEPQLHGLQLMIGTGGVPVYLPPGGLSQTPYGTLFGRPVVPIEQAATLGTQGDIILADFSQYRLIDKGNMTPAQSIHVRFIYDESVFRFTYRVDGQPEWSSALTPKNGSATQSPFVVLDTRA